MKAHHNTGNQYAKKDDTLDAQITFRTRQQIKNELMRKKDELGVEKLTDLMNMACEYFLSNYQQVKNPINQESIMKAKLINNQGCVFDSTEASSLKAAKEWAKDRGSDDYKLVITKGESETAYTVRNNRFCKAD